MISFLKTLLFPKLCFGCKRFGSYLCQDCLEKLPFHRQICFYCKKPSFLGMTCFGCRKLHRPDLIFCLYYYNPVIQSLMKAVKFRLAMRSFEEVLFVIKKHNQGILNEFSSLISGEDLFVEPIPLHKNRLKQRGFNQAEIISKVFFSQSSNHILQKIKDTPPQSYLSLKERKQNIAGSFEVVNPEKVEKKTLLLVDDVVTSGKTVEVACRVLKRSGADKVFVFALAGK